MSLDILRDQIKVPNTRDERSALGTVDKNIDKSQLNKGFKRKSSELIIPKEV